MKAAALLCLYFVWGSTYFAMRLALSGFPPLLMAGIRFVVAAGMLFGLARLRGAPRLDARGWKIAALTGVLLLGIGNGGVALAERTVPSGLAALVIGTMPLWASLFARALGERISALEASGLVVGFIGIVFLNLGTGLGGAPSDVAAVLVAPVAWALGTTITRRSKIAAGVSLSAAQMLVGGMALLAVSALTGERLERAPNVVAVAAIAYLAVFGSVLAFTAYGYLLRTTRASTATSYAYVNPIVAIAIGAALGGEPFTLRAGVAALAITGGVLLLLRGRARGAEDLREARSSPAVG